MNQLFEVPSCFVVQLFHHFLIHVIHGWLIERIDMYGIIYCDVRRVIVITVQSVVMVRCEVRDVVPTQIIDHLTFGYVSFQVVDSSKYVFTVWARVTIDRTVSAYRIWRMTFDEDRLTNQRRWTAIDVFHVLKFTSSAGKYLQTYFTL